MKHTRSIRHPRRFTCVVGTALLLTVLGPTLRGDMPKINRFGFDGFRLMLQQHDLTTLQTSTDETFGSPTETAVVLVGNLDQASVLFDELQTFVLNGGATLVATDLGTRRPLFGVKFNAGPVQTVDDAYRGLHDCPVVTRIDRASVVTRGVRRIVTNRPGYLSFGRRGQLEVCCSLPATDRQRRRLMGYRHFPGRGRILLVADHSLFINEMLMHGDNAKLASNVATWLCEGRKNLVFIEDGQVLPAWQLGAAPESIPLAELFDEAQRRGLGNLIPDSGLFSLVNDMAAAFEDDNGFNRKFAYPFYRVAERKIWRVLALSAFALALLGSLKWIVVSKSKLLRWRDPNRGQPIGESRYLASLRANEYGPCLRILARELFAFDGVKVWQAQTAPHAIVQANRRRTKRLVRKYWQLATASDPPRLTRRAFWRSMKSLTKLRRLQTDGLLRLEWPDSESCETAN